MFKTEIAKLKNIFNVQKEVKEVKKRVFSKKIFVFLNGDMCGLSNPYLHYTCIEAEENVSPEFIQAYERTCNGESLRNWTFIGYVNEASEEACYGLIDDFFVEDGKFFKY